MFFWEFTVLLRKVLLLGVALFWEDAFLQSVVGIFVLMLSIVTHMACWPYNEAFLNIAELCTLISLFTMVALSILLWYVQQRSDSVELYELAATVILFVEYAAIGTALVVRIVYLELRERSGTVVRYAAFTRPFFDQLVRFEDWVRWNVRGGGEWDSSTEGEANAAWAFHRPLEVKEGITETKLETMRRLWRRRGGGKKGAVQAAQEEEQKNEEPDKHRARETRNPLGGTALSI